MTIKTECDKILPEKEGVLWEIQSQPYQQLQE